jgi:hypothetical protein
MFTNNLISLILSGTIYIFWVLYYGDNSHVTILNDKQILFDCIMIGISGAIG